MKKQKIYILTTLLLYGSALFGFSEKTTTELTNAVKTEYLKEYPSIIVSNVIITDMSKEQPDDSRLVGMELQRQSLTKSSSTLIAILENGQKKTKRVFVRYEVEKINTATPCNAHPMTLHCSGSKIGGINTLKISIKLK